MTHPRRRMPSLSWRGPGTSSHCETPTGAGYGVPSVRIKCEGGTVKEEFLPGLRARPEFLPETK